MTCPDFPVSSEAGSGLEPKSSNSIVSSERQHPRDQSKKHTLWGRGREIRKTNQPVPEKRNMDFKVYGQGVC